jgi:hypothetical protein
MQEILPSGCTWWTVTRLRVIHLLPKCPDRLNYPDFHTTSEDHAAWIINLQTGRRASASFIISRINLHTWLGVAISWAQKGNTPCICVTVNINNTSIKCRYYDWFRPLPFTMYSIITCISRVLRTLVTNLLTAKITAPFFYEETMQPRARRTFIRFLRNTLQS